MDGGFRIARVGLFAIRHSPWRVGFTLLELTLVMVTLGIVLLAVTPRLQQTAQRLRAEQAAAELSQLMRVAHEQAVASSQETVWIWDAPSHRARVETVPQDSGDEPKDAAPQVSTVIAQSAQVPDGIFIELTRTEEPLDCRCVHFFPEGTSEQATLTVRLSAQILTATVDEATSQVNFAS